MPFWGGGGKVFGWFFLTWGSDGAAEKAEAKRSGEEEGQRRAEGEGGADGKEAAEGGAPREIQGGSKAAEEEDAAMIDPLPLWVNKLFTGDDPFNWVIYFIFLPPILHQRI